MSVAAVPVRAGRFADVHFHFGLWDGGGRRLRGRRCGTLPFARHGALGVFEPARVAVVAALLAFAHFQHAEHAAHANGAKGAVSGHHQHGVFGQVHFHLGHVVHAALAHHHVVRYQAGDLLGHFAVVHANHGGHGVAHRIHGVVALV